MGFIVTRDIDGTLRFNVTNLTDYYRCPRLFWMHKKLRIQKNQSGFSYGRQFHSLLHSWIHLLSRALKNDLPTRVVGTDILLCREVSDIGVTLSGAIDVVRKAEEGYIIQENKSSNPPKDRWVYRGDKLQVDAYAFLMEEDKRFKDAPIKGGVILYNDLRPREVESETALIPKMLEKMKQILECDTLPKAGSSNCSFCYYYPLCQTLPQEGGLKPGEIFRF